MEQMASSNSLNYDRPTSIHQATFSDRCLAIKLKSIQHSDGNANYCQQPVKRFLLFKCMGLRNKVSPWDSFAEAFSSCLTRPLSTTHLCFYALTSSLVISNKHKGISFSLYPFSLSQQRSYSTVSTQIFTIIQGSS